MTTDGGSPDPGRAGPGLLLGPVLRYVAETEATIWVETDRACQVEVLGHQARTFEVNGHHYYCVLYREAWTEPSVRLLLSAVPTAMIFDDHDDHDGVPHLQAVCDADLS